MRSIFFAVALCTSGCSNDVVFGEYDIAPTASITAPEDGATYDEGVGVEFVGRVADDADETDLFVEWSSDLDGVLPGGDTVDSAGWVQFTTANLSPGNHAISLVVEDGSGGVGTDTVTIGIIDLPEAPQVTIVRPTPGEEIREHEDYDFVVLVEDAQDEGPDLTSVMASDLEGEVCAFTVDILNEGRCTAALGPGYHLLTVTAVDLDGDQGEATAYLDVLDGDDIDDDGDGWTENQGDCDDTDDLVNPAMDEVAYDGVDQDCLDGDLEDLDGDGYGAELIGGADCDDEDAAIHPGQPEIPYDGIDNDCNSLTSDDDLDGDGALGVDDCDDDDPDVSPDLVEVPYDGKDNDCNSFTPDDDLDGDGYELATDCDDIDPLVNPGNTEVIYDGKDNDCDPLTLDNDLDEDGYLVAFDCNDLDAQVNPGMPEVPYDGKDNDCLGGDECDVDGDGALSDHSLCGGADCDDDDTSIGPNELEECDNIDHDCDGQVHAVNAIGCSIWFYDSDNDGYGTGSYQCQCEPSASPPFRALNDDDCYDHNDDVRPNQTQFFSDDRGDGSFDYNCINGEEVYWTDTRVYSCATGLLGFGCSSDPGWESGRPDCGDVEDWLTGCDQSLIIIGGCEAEFQDPYTQSCR